ncbi:MAG: hypothetical protein HQL54_14685 [Magnetococcales bacterium]|nr:hypothetical protein [Magnetococcales bacterium]
MKATKTILIPFVSSLVLMPSMGSAGEKIGDFTLSANLTLTSNYITRGFTQTHDRPAIQGEIGAMHDLGFYAGIWASNVRLVTDDGAVAEVDYYGGYSKTLENGFMFDLGYAYYDYPGSDEALEYGFGEYYLQLGYTLPEQAPLSGLGLRVKYLYTPDYYGSTASESASYVDSRLNYRLPYEIGLGAHLGYSFGEYFDNVGAADDYDSYTDFSVSLSRALEGFDFKVTYYGTDSDGETLGATDLDRVGVSVSKSF